MVLFRVLLDVCGGACLGGAHQQCMSELGIVEAQVEAADDAATREFGEHRCDRSIEQQHGFVEAWSIEGQLHALDARQCRDQLLRGAMAFIGHALQALRA